VWIVEVAIERRRVAVGQSPDFASSRAGPARGGSMADTIECIDAIDDVAEIDWKIDCRTRDW